MDCIGYGAHNDKGLLVPIEFKRRIAGPDDVTFRITHCGVCYAEVKWVFNKIGTTKYPIVPGHEVVGVVTAVGDNVKRFQVGDRVGVGPFCNSCQKCEYCNKNMENSCLKHPTLTYDGIDVDGSVTKGGFSNAMVTHQRFCVKIPDNLASDVAAPFLCAGITVWSPMMRHHMNQAGKSLGVIGLGGLGHMAVKFGQAFGLHVTVISTSPAKEEEALRVIGADAFIVSKDEAAMKAAAGSLDFIVDTASGMHPLDPYLLLLKQEGIITIVSAPPEMKFTPAILFRGLKTITGSTMGGMKEMQEMLDFSAEKGVTPMIETIPINYANEALKRLQNKDVHYRFVIDIENSLKESIK
jgi:cinnamyl-alcohol dehydrogenase